MPLDGVVDDIVADLDLLDAIGRRYEAAATGLLRLGAAVRTLQQWFGRRGQVPDDIADKVCLMAMALDLELFTPSPSGRTAMDRYLATARATDDLDRRALEALRAARWRLVRIDERVDRDVILASDLVSGESLRVLQDRISPLATGVTAVMRLCPLASGRHALISPLFALDAEAVATALGFVRPGKGLGDGYRCAATVYRDCARRGLVAIPVLAEPFDDPDGAMEASEVEQLALRWSRHADPVADEDLLEDIRQAASVANVIEACGCAASSAGLEDVPPAAFEVIARLQLETIARRASAGLLGYDDAVARVGAAIARDVAAGHMPQAARRLYERLAAALAPAVAKQSDSADLARVLSLIHALRERTVERGCSEAEAMAAAAKVAELLDRHDLTLDEITVRRSDCEGVGVDSGRRRSTEVDVCIGPVAAFCDCRVWSETGEGGQIRYIYFGLKADVQAARVLHELVEAAFEIETTEFRHGPTYRGLPPGHRRKAMSSFRIGLAHGIRRKLDAIRSGRGVGSRRGFDLVAVKRSVVDDEVARLGLGFTNRRVGGRRMVDAEAYRAGEAAGSLFEPRPILERAT